MVALGITVGGLLLAFVLVALNGLFVAAEFAFVRVRSTSVEQLVADGRTGASTLQEVMENLDDYLAVTQLGITLASLGLGWVGEPAVASLIEPLLGPFVPESMVHLVSFALGFGFITFLHVVFGELVPKTVAIAQAERIALWVAPPMKFCYYLFYPGLVFFNGTANAFTRFIGIPPASEADETLEERELRRVFARSGQAGHIDPDEVEMIDQVFELDDRLVRSIMISRPDVTSVPDDATIETIRSIVERTGHTRYPVVSTTEREQVLGFLDVKDIVTAGTDMEPASTLTREIIVVPETMKADELLLQFQDEGQQMAAVIDEWGAFEGIVTVEDVLEAIVGDLRDVFDDPDADAAIRHHPDGGYEADGAVSISRINEVLGMAFESSGYDTVSGLVLEHLGRAPQTGDELNIDGVHFLVTSIEGNRITSLRFEKLE